MYDYVRRSVDNMFVNTRWNSDHVHKSFFYCSAEIWEDKTYLIFYMDISSMLFCICQSDAST